MFTDEHRRIIWTQIRQRDLRQFGDLLTPHLLAAAARSAGVAMGRGALNLATLCWLALSGALNDGCNFAGVLTLTLKLLADMDRAPAERPTPKKRGKRSKHDPHGRGNAISEEAFAQARQKMPLNFFGALIRLLTAAFTAQHESLCRFCGLRLLALDGTCVDLPDRGALGEYFGWASNGQGKHRPQARLVMLQLALVRLPWRYALAPLKLGERLVGGWLLKDLSPKDLVLMDKGFWSFGLFHRIQKKQAFFAIRRMGGVKFKRLRRLGHKDWLVQWTPSNRKWKSKFLPKAMTLRVIEYRIKGFRPGAIVTNMLDARLISRAQWTQVACSEPGRRLEAGLYHRRWEIETSFAELKVSQGMEANLRGRTPQTIAYEVAGHVLLYLLTRWLMVQAAVKHGLNPLRLSFIETQRELSRMATLFVLADSPSAVGALLERLLDYIAEHRVPWRPGRSFPRPRDGKIKNKGRGKKVLPSRLEVEQA